MMTTRRPLGPKARERREDLGALANNLARLRVEAGLTHRALAHMANVSPTTISSIELGKVTDPGVSIVYRIALALRVQIEDLIGVSPLRDRDRVLRRSREFSASADIVRADQNSMPGDTPAER